jgi:hypothetical protein
MAEDTLRVDALEPFIGAWSVEAEFSAPGPGTVRGHTSFRWLLGRRFVEQSADVDLPEAPDGQMIITPDSRRPGGYLQHYFDSRGVVRLYAMTFDGRIWTLSRVEPDFSPLDFAQRFTGTFSADGHTIAGQWETSADGVEWVLDFRLTYRRTA